jgi:NTE family protein
LLKNYEKGPDYSIDSYADEVLKASARGSLLYKAVVDFASYSDPEKIFVHLSDGGVSDNLGLVPIIASLNNPDARMNVVPTIPAGSEQKVVILAVNAAVHPQDTLSYHNQPPGFLKLINTASTTPMGWFSDAQLQLLSVTINNIELQRAAEAGQTPPPGSNAARALRSESPRRFYYTEIGFDKIADDEQRTFFQTIPTSFTLEPESVDRLRTLGSALLDNDAVFQRLLEDIRKK